MSYDYNRVCFDSYDYHSNSGAAYAARASQCEKARAGFDKGTAASVPLSGVLWEESSVTSFPSWTTGNIGGRGG